MTSTVERRPLDNCLSQKKDQTGLQSGDVNLHAAVMEISC